MAMTQEPIDWRYQSHIRPIFQAYVREYPHNSYGQKYGTNVPPLNRILEISHDIPMIFFIPPGGAPQF